MASFESQLQDAQMGAASLEVAASLPGEPDAKKLQTRDLRESPTTLDFGEPPAPGDPANLMQFASPAPKPTGTEPKTKKKPPRRATAESPNVCFECKTTDSKLWRRGPDGNLMCNACGLRWRRSNKAKDTPKSTPRKRKLPNATSVSPQSPQPMSLPQSSMAAQRGGMMNNSFGTGSGIYAPMSATTQNFGQLQYQPQNMYLQQQQMQTQLRQQQQQPQSQQQQNNHHPHRQNPSQLQQHHLPKKDDSQIDPALMADESIASGGIDPTLQNLPHAGLLAPQNGVSTVKTNLTNSNDTNAHYGHTPSLADLGQLNGQATQDARHSLSQQIQNVSQMQPGRTHAGADSMNLHTPISDGTSLLQNPDSDAGQNGDAGQNEDFSQLLSLKAFVDDAGRHF